MPRAETRRNDPIRADYRPTRIVPTFDLTGPGEPGWNSDPSEGLPLTIVGILIVILLILLVVYLVRRVV
jgi:hypothetical protein